MDEPRRRGGPRHHDHDVDFDASPRARRGGRMRRGETRTAVLAVLADAPAHGYEIIQTLEERSGGLWRPSPGSVYPLLQLLEDEGMVQAIDRDGKRVFTLTDTGRDEATQRLGEGPAPWDRSGRSGRPAGELRMALQQLHLAVKQIGIAGDPAQIERAGAIVRKARKELYQLLAED